MLVNQKIYNFLKNTTAEDVIVYGGARSGKSYTVAQYLLQKFLCEKDKHFLITRKTTPSLKLSCYMLIKDLIRELNIDVIEHRADRIIEFQKNMIIFRGLDDPEKIKSTEFNYIWMEEANEFSLFDYRQLKLRLSRKTNGAPNQIFLTFNPLYEKWVYDLVQESNADKLRVNYKDNLRFLSKEYTDQLEHLKNEDESFYKIYTLGDFAQPTNLIYKNWSMCQIFPEEFDEIIYGLDFGYNNPTCLLKIGIKDNEDYILEEVYKTYLTNEDVINILRDQKIMGTIYADSSEPARIEEISRAGFDIRPADKSVKDGIDFCKRRKVHVSAGCPNFIKEIKGYKYKETSKGEVLDEPVKFMDHAMDALRYAVYTHCSSRNEVGVAWL